MECRTGITTGNECRKKLTQRGRNRSVDARSLWHRAGVLGIGDRRAAGCAWGDGLAPSVEFDRGATDLRRVELQESEDLPAREKICKMIKPHRRGPIVACQVLVEGWPCKRAGLGRGRICFGSKIIECQVCGSNRSKSSTRIGRQIILCKR